MIDFLYIIYINRVILNAPDEIEDIMVKVVEDKALDKEMASDLDKNLLLNKFH